MPFYEYECPSCRHTAEVMQKISDAPLKKCPACGKAGFKRLISAPVFRLKGSGWYETDFKSDKEGKRNLAGRDDDAGAKPAADAKNDVKSDAKPAAEATPAKSEAAAPAAKAEAPAAKSKSAARTAPRGKSAARPAARKKSAGSRRK